MENSVLAPDYLTIDDMLDMIDGSNRDACKKILSDNRTAFLQAWGSTNNHQTWDGGYIDHITDGMNYARHLFGLELSFRRIIPFTLSDVLLIFFLHDLEKPWRTLVDGSRHASHRSGLDTKSAFKVFCEEKLREYGIDLTDRQKNALTYILGEGKDYLPTERVMSELAGFCHMVDVWSARVRHDYPKEVDEWKGAGRFRSSH